METEVLNPAIQTPPPGEAAPPSTEEPVSVSDHAAQFDPKRPPDAEVPASASSPDQPERQGRRHRQKDIATPADVPRIAELTKKLREAERERDEWKTKAATPTTSVPEPAKATAIAEKVPVVVDKPSDKPTWKQFEDLIGAKYETWGDAQDAYVDARDAWKESQARSAYAEQQVSQAQQSVLQGYTTKAQEYAKSQPDFFETMAKAAPMLDHIPDLLFQSIVRHDNGPELAYYLVQHPADLAELHLLTDGKSVNDASVAILQRRLDTYRPLTASIASVPTIPSHAPAPRPPNAMRTAPMKTGDDLPGEGHSLAQHRQAFAPKRR